MPELDATRGRRPGPACRSATGSARRARAPRAGRRSAPGRTRSCRRRGRRRARRGRRRRSRGAIARARARCRSGREASGSGASRVRSVGRARGGSTAPRTRAQAPRSAAARGRRLGRRLGELRGQDEGPAGLGDPQLAAGRLDDAAGEPVADAVGRWLARLGGGAGAQPPEPGLLVRAPARSARRAPPPRRRRGRARSRRAAAARPTPARRPGRRAHGRARRAPRRAARARRRGRRRRRGRAWPAPAPGPVPGAAPAGPAERQQRLGCAAAAASLGISASTGSRSASAASLRGERVGPTSPPLRSRNTTRAEASGSGATSISTARPSRVATVSVQLVRASAAVVNSVSRAQAPDGAQRSAQKAAIAATPGPSSRSIGSMPQSASKAELTKTSCRTRRRPRPPRTSGRASPG